MPRYKVQHMSLVPASHISTYLLQDLLELVNRNKPTHLYIELREEINESQQNKHS
jgi:hypothetical protein